MNLPEIYYLYTLLTATAVLLAVAIIAISRFGRQCRRLEQFWNSPTGAAIADTSRPQDRQQLLINLRLERQLGQLQAKIDSLGADSPSSAGNAKRQLPIDNAIRMAKNGASVDELTRSCGLNVGEARLMIRLHGKSASARHH